MDALIRELKSDLSKEKIQIVDLLLAQIEAYEASLKNLKSRQHVEDQLRLIDEIDVKAA